MERLMEYITTQGSMDGASWKEQLTVLSSDVEDTSKRMVLYTMSARRLFKTAVVSPRHYRTVSRFLEFLVNNDIEEHCDASETGGSVSSASDMDTADDDTSCDASSFEACSDVDMTEDVDANDTTVGATRPVGFNDLPPEIGLEVIRDLTYADKSRLSVASLTSAAVVSQALRQSAVEILLRFRLRFEEVQLMLTATGSIICGSAVPALLKAPPSFEPGDLDFAAASGQGAFVVDFLIIAGGYKITKNAVDYSRMAGINKLWTLRNGSLKVNVMESVSNNALDVVTFFHLSCVYGAWTATGVWHGYAAETTSGIAMTTPAKFPIRSAVARRRSMWIVLRKYMARGFTIELNEYTVAHRCGVDLNCPATLRTSDDEGCSFTAFPDWHYTTDATPHPVVCWSMGGTGCPQGILHRPGGQVTPATAVIDDNWKHLVRLFMNSSVPPSD
ncbi:hypothetical protein B0H16DRAFT_1723601 [Mycena metata]|uniref:F-box domain-containing protein n=1 Tax=Mycena metata TaxID=1033252 RepID=A0AAD7N9Q6_9AGAR|nr:hypothetical protein B0H16DRAFT_1723601 [Mycena metata]